MRVTPSPKQIEYLDKIGALHEDYTLTTGGSLSEAADVSARHTSGSWFSGRLLFKRACFWLLILTLLLVAQSFLFADTQDSYVRVDPCASLRSHGPDTPLASNPFPAAMAIFSLAALSLPYGLGRKSSSLPQLHTINKEKTRRIRLTHPACQDKGVAPKTINCPHHVQPLNMHISGETAESESAPKPVTSPETGSASELPESLRLQPIRLSQVDCPTPEDLLRGLNESMIRRINGKLSGFVPRVSWSIGMASIKGNVRSENQDYALAFTCGKLDCLVVADGCGGLPHGRMAAYTAVAAAAATILRECNFEGNIHRLNPEDLAVNAIYSAAHALGEKSDKLNISDMQGGLRTTLIVVVADPGKYGFAYIGDGGGTVIRNGKSAESFLVPQKADPNMLNVLAASLGPVTEGKPESGSMPRRSGDLLLAGTDGIFDYVDDVFPSNSLNACLHFQGDLNLAANAIVNQLADFQDDFGYLCSDNLTIGLMGTCSAPGEIEERDEWEATLC
jgi:serine/threonine protein phosphatase PrpC